MALTATVALVALGDSTSSLLPTGDGAYVSWTTSSGSPHYALVDESSCNGTTDYNYTETVGNRDSYSVSLAGIPDGATITAIDVTPCASKNRNGGSASVIDVFYRLNGSDSADAGAYSLSGTTPTPLSATSFSLLSTIKDSATFLEIGAKLTSGSKGARLSNISAIVAYTPLLAPSNLTATSTATTTPGNKLDWADNSSNESSFRIERGTDGVNFAEIAFVAANVTTYSDHNLPPGTYYYRVRAANVGGYSGYSNVVSRTIP